MSSTVQTEETLISGYADLAAFLTQKGFPISKITLAKYTQDGSGPPIHGSWANRNTFLPSAALDWARAREQAKIAPRAAVVPDDVPPI